jgi:hypothetical protein
MAMLEPATSIPAALQELLDKDAIRQVLIRYGRGWDRAEGDLVAGAYHPEAIDDHGFYEGLGRDFFATRAAQGSASQSTHLHHQFGQSNIEIHGDTAVAETYALVTAVGPTDDGVAARLTAVRYHDRFEKRDGLWKIAARRVAFDADVFVPGGLPTAYPEKNRGTRDRNDYSYELFELPHS